MEASDIVALPLQLGTALSPPPGVPPVGGTRAAGRIERIAPAEVGLPVESADILGRVSKAIGTPGGLRDLIGLAWRMPPRTSATTL